jgi:hypothetical protein
MELDAMRDRFFEGVSRYRYVETLGRGKTGAVFQVIDRDTGRLLALKVFASKPWAEYGELLARFRREVGLNGIRPGQDPPGDPRRGGVDGARAFLRRHDPLGRSREYPHGACDGGPPPGPEAVELNGAGIGRSLGPRLPDDLSLVPDLPATVRETVLRALGKRPVDRFRTALAFADALSVADP